MKRRSFAAVGLALALSAISATAMTANATASGAGAGARAPFTLAVYGDAPYGTSPTDTSEFDATPAFIANVNADPDVGTVIHVGDIHSGKQYCTAAYDQSVAALWKTFADPMVYTPGDNEWADCHKAKEGGGTYNPLTGKIDYVLDPATGHSVAYASGNPAANLDLVRKTFFPKPGHTLGSGTLRVLSQAQLPNWAHPEDAKYVENVLWVKNGTLFVTVNVPGGSNNDADPWYGAPTASRQQLDEAAQRTAADLRWLDTAFALAKAGGMSSVVVTTQADMWDVDGKTADHVANYEPVVSSLARHTAAFGKPVLLLVGDSHVYRSDNPLTQGAPCTGDEDVCAYDAWNSHPGYAVPNFHRIVVHGSTTPLEWLKLTVTPGAHNPTTSTSFGPFTWTRITES
ncbi:hypothetical protein G3I60_30300 [Streptomyces sp. SID13666]|uniref:hypothetical protein n=1 Tax=unclassified Streptomyces TaxID=2593676 RepID=UPI0013C156A4|nr:MULTISPECIES: hypothetical protein [unclassified Streptomyces]NEA58330.1 hypothetical protein [Streptomyces sp. SID13666]NEA76951.1 hypothetical protein [Streptomyces sp. SID13588]